MHFFSGLISHRRMVRTVFAAALASGGVAAAAPAYAAAGWQNVGSFTFSPGVVSQQIGYNCPSTLPVAHSGSFAFNSVGQTTEVFLTYNGTRIDIPSFSE